LENIKKSQLMEQKNKIRFISDKYVNILLYGDTPLIIYWNSRQQGGKSFYQIIENYEFSDFEIMSGMFITDVYQQAFKKLDNFVTGDYELAVVKSVKNCYEFHYSASQRYYSNFAQVFNQKNNENYSIPIIDKEFKNLCRVFNWKESFRALTTSLDINSVRQYESLIKSNAKPFITIFQNCIYQKGFYEDGYSWVNLEQSPFFILYGHNLIQAYKNLQIKPNFILISKKDIGDSKSEYEKDKDLIKSLCDRFLNQANKDLIEKYN
jgi:hypothetical protein